ncbi:MAG TPA: hypothetical protein VM618_04155 [Acidimicrobiia bacterium]|nr:hypothetical protein [Acidimicrobiia bacterium]
MTALAEATYPVRLGFTPSSVAIADPDHPGLFRAGPRAGAPYGDRNVEVHVCAATDGLASGATQPGLTTFGFDTVDLEPLGELQRTCAAVRLAGQIDDDQAAVIRASLEGAVLRTSGSGSIRVLHLADEGFIMRTAGPNGMRIVGPESTGMNGHGGATSVHADQDVYGTPVKQLMDGKAPSLFVHDSPDGHNHDASLLLANLWIPLQQITQPLVLADGRSIDRRRHQLRYGLATGSFLERDDDMAINDIWSFLHDDAQRWHFRSFMDHRSAYVFNTLSTPHGAGTLPGEEVAEQCYRALEEAESAVAGGNVAGLDEATSAAAGIELPAPATPALTEAIGAMLDLLAEAAGAPEAVCGAQALDWTARSRAARRQVVRMSLELRMVVSTDVG